MEIKPVIIFGASGLGKVALEIFESHGVVVYGFLDEDKAKHGNEIGIVSVLGDPEDHGFLKLIGQKCDAFIATDEIEIRKSHTEMLNEKRKVMPINAIHKAALLASNAEIGYGNLINSGARINTMAKIANHCTIHSNVVIDFEATVADYVQIGAGSIINSGVEIGEGTFIGSGAIVVSGVKIGKNARVGAGSVVIKDIGEDETVFGNPAEKVG